MLNLNKEDEKKVICGTVIGGIVALGLTIYCAAKKHKRSPVKDFKCAISEIVDTFEESKHEACSAVHEVEEKIKKNDSVISDFFALASVGVSLWKKFQKGK